MTGWDTSADIIVESVEEIIDTNPDLYKQRTIMALNECRYSDALQDAAKALEYSHGEAQYHVLILRVLFEAGNYASCMDYLSQKGLWKKRKDPDLLPDERNYIYYVRGVCHRECHMSDSSINAVIITPDGRGMCVTIQEALKRSGGKKDIFLTAGTYEENIKLNRDIRIYSEPGFNPEIVGNIEIDSANVELAGITIGKKDSGIPLVSLGNSKCSFENVIIEGSGRQTTEIGLFILGDCNDITLKNISIRNCRTGLFSGCVDLVIDQGNITDCESGIVCYGQDDKAYTTIENTTVKSCMFGISIGTNCFGIIKDSVIDRNTGGIRTFDAKCEKKSEPAIKIESSIIKRSKEYGIMAGSISRIKVFSSEIIGGSGYAVIAKDWGICELTGCKVKNNLVSFKEEDYGRISADDVVELNNDVAGLFLQGIKNLFTD